MVTIIAAVADNGIIGNNNDLPWHVPEDLKRFRTLTEGKVVVMGRKTFESIVARLGHPLPRRQNAVITSNPAAIRFGGVQVFPDISLALERFKDREVCVIGGARVFAEALPRADKLYLTHVHQSPAGDVYFPEVHFTEWKKVSEEKHEGYTFAEYERIG